MIGEDNDGFPFELPDDFDNEGFGSVDEDGLQDIPRSMLDENDLYRVLCSVATRIVKAREEGRVADTYNLCLLEDLEGRILHIHRTATSLPETVAFPVCKVPETGDLGERDAQTVDDFIDPSGPKAYFKLVDAVRAPGKTPITSYYLEIHRS